MTSDSPCFLPLPPINNLQAWDQHNWSCLPYLSHHIRQGNISVSDKGCSTQSKSCSGKIKGFRTSYKRSNSDLEYHLRYMVTLEVHASVLAIEMNLLPIFEKELHLMRQGDHPIAIVSHPDVCTVHHLVSHHVTGASLSFKSDLTCKLISACFWTEKDISYFLYQMVCRLRSD